MSFIVCALVSLDTHRTQMSEAQRAAQAKAARKEAKAKQDARFNRIKNLDELTQMQRAYLMDIPDEQVSHYQHRAS